MTSDTRLGQGHSGAVCRSCDAAGRDIARKVFGSRGPVKVVQYLFLGAPNPCMWSEPALCCAVLRRRILTPLVRYWFGPKLRVAAAYGHAWNRHEGAFEISCELIDGRHAQLHHPYTEPVAGEKEELIEQIMKPLQQRLEDAGFDGLVWQAGRGNPVAMSNFMREHRAPHAWVWVDLESGVPAVLPLNPVQLMTFYFPMAVRHRRPLFDDVDVPRLRRYLEAHRDTLNVAALAPDVDQLEKMQDQWKRQPRYQRGIAHRLSQGAINYSQAAWYASRSGEWYAREIAVNLWPLARQLIRTVGRLCQRIVCADYIALAGAGWRLVSSRKFRRRVTRRYINSRIDRWEQRRQFTAEQTRDLRARVADACVDRTIAQFIVYDAFTVLGAALPVWGGADTQTEHWFNRLPDWFLRRHMKSDSDKESSPPQVPLRSA